MKIRALIIWVALLASGACAATTSKSRTQEAVAPAKALRAQLQDPDGPVLVVAHRACFADGAPENSLAAIQQCLDLGADMVEIDVALSSDGIPVLMHDQTLDRMTQRTGAVSDRTAAELVSLRLRAREGGKYEPFTEEKVPTLRQALELARDHILINLDVKGEAYAPTFELVSKLEMGDQIIMKMAAGPDDASLLSAPFLGETFFMPVIRQCTENTMQGACAPVLSAVVSGYDRYDPIAYEVTFISLDYFVEGIPKMLANDRRIWVNTLEPHHAAGLVDDDALIDPDSVWGQLVEMGVDMIQTDNPRELIDYLRSRGMREGNVSGTGS